ncbi:Glucose-6-phosphate_1-epimerase [Hexamita inflata]|nr:Glucose-6-phosphate 1-epimerase [Hexamita inflata]
MSPHAILDGSKAIRGGIPICWPWFGGERSPQHGTARVNNFWLIEEKSLEDQLLVKLLFVDQQHQLSLIISFGVESSKFWMRAQTTNKSEQKTRFSTAFHAYFKVRADSASVSSLNGNQYFDKFANTSDIISDQITFENPVDYVVQLNNQNQVQINSNNQPKLNLNLINCNTIIVWNPKNAAQISDLKTADEFICVEPASLFVDIGPGEEHELGFEVVVV